MKVLVGIPTAEMARYGRFYDYISMLRLPRGSFVAYSRSQTPSTNRNTLIKLALEQDCTHVLFFDDDIAMPPDTLEKLAAHDKDMVTGLYLMRHYPHRPIIFDLVTTDGRAAWHFLKEGETGLIPVVGAGLGCCLIKTEVFKAMPQPWITIGEMDQVNWNDDISFFNRARALGFKLYCDLTVRCGHMCTTAVYPNLVNGQWIVSYDTMGTAAPSFLMEKMSEAEKAEREKYDYLPTY